MKEINNQTQNATRKQTLNLNEKCNEWLKRSWWSVSKEEADMFLLEVHHYM